MAAGNNKDYSKELLRYETEIKNLEKLEVEIETNITNQKEQLEEIDKELKNIGVTPEEAEKLLKKLKQEIDDISSKLDKALPKQSVNSINDLIKADDDDEDLSF
jgi:predicted  nucleic acid-binding Zn-ribbon protein